MYLLIYIYIYAFLCCIDLYMIYIHVYISMLYRFIYAIHTYLCIFSGEEMRDWKSGGLS